MQPSAPLTAQVSQTQVVTEGVPGGIQTRTLTVTASVSSIDHATRQVTLVDDQGGKQTFSVGSEAVNFQQVEVGDRVTLSYLEEVVIYLRPLQGDAGEVTAAVAAERAGKGQKPAGLVTAAVEITAVVSAVDLVNHTATLVFPTGESRVVPVRPDVVLHEDQVGQQVVILQSSSVAIAVEKVESEAP